MDDLQIMQKLDTLLLTLQRVASALERSNELDEAYLAWEQLIRKQDLQAEQDAFTSEDPRD